MKNIWLILLASMVLCLSSFVFNENEEASVLELKAEMELSSIEMDKVIEWFDYAMKESVFHYPQYKEYENRWNKYKDTSSKALAFAIIPENKNEAMQFAKKWNDRSQESIQNTIKDERAIQDKSKYFSMDVDSDFYHANKAYKSFLSEILKMKVKSTQVAVANYLLERQISCCLCFCSDEVCFPSNLKLQHGKKSEIPMVLDVSCRFYEKYYIKKLWINEQLVHQNIYDFNLKNSKVDLVYNGEERQTVKVNLYRNFDFMETKERTYNFDIQECDK